MKNTTATLKKIGQNKVTRAARPGGTEFALRPTGGDAIPIFSVPTAELAPLHDRLAVEVARRILNTPNP